MSTIFILPFEGFHTSSSTICQYQDHKSYSILMRGPAPPLMSFALKAKKEGFLEKDVKAGSVHGRA